MHWAQGLQVMVDSHIQKEEGVFLDEAFAGGQATMSHKNIGNYCAT